MCDFYQPKKISKKYDLIGSKSSENSSFGISENNPNPAIFFSNLHFGLLTLKTNSKFREKKIIDFEFKLRNFIS